MNREIKFRGNRIDNKELITGDLMFHKRFTEKKPYIKTNSKGQIEWFEVHPDSVGQFTGLKDKNGKEIYEGDITADDIYGNYTVKWSDNDCLFFLNHEELDSKDLYKQKAEVIEVIGNIYENPDLL